MTSETIVVDTGFWIALFDSRDEHYEKAGELNEYLEDSRVIVPWPVVYETLRTRFVRNQEWIDGFDRILKRGNIHYIEDEGFRSDAYDMVISSRRRDGRSLSMVDATLRLIIADASVRTDYLLTFNHVDFADVCSENSTRIL